MEAIEECEPEESQESKPAAVVELEPESKETPPPASPPPQGSHQHTDPEPARGRKSAPKDTAPRKRRTAAEISQAKIDEAMKH